MATTTNFTAPSPQPPAADSGALAGLGVLFILGLAILVYSTQHLRNKCIHIPFGSLSFVSVFLYAALDVASVDAPWLITVLGITVFLWFVVAVAAAYCSCCAPSALYSTTLDKDDNSLNGLDDGL